MSGSPVSGTRPLHGRVGLVTGSTSGIGWAIASGLAEAGADVMLNGFWNIADGPARGLGLAVRCRVRVAHLGADVALGAEVARMVNIASAHGLVAWPFKSAYVAPKQGVVGLTKAVALEVAEAAITCYAVCPGFVRTAMVEAQIAALVLFLWLDQAASITGAALPVDGAWTAR